MLQVVFRRPPKPHVIIGGAFQTWLDLECDAGTDAWLDAKIKGSYPGCEC